MLRNAPRALLGATLKLGSPGLCSRQVRTFAFAFLREVYLIRHAGINQELSIWAGLKGACPSLLPGISIHDDLLHDAFARFDTDNSGYITLPKPGGLDSSSEHQKCSSKQLTLAMSAEQQSIGKSSEAVRGHFEGMCAGLQQAGGGCIFEEGL